MHCICSALIFVAQKTSKDMSSTSKTKDIIRTERVSLEWNDAISYEIEAEVTLPAAWNEYADRIKVLWTKKVNWMTGGGYNTDGTAPFESIPKEMQAQLLGAVATKANSRHVLRNFS